MVSREVLYTVYIHTKKQIALQMKGRWESNINVWFPFMYSHKWNCAASLFPEQNYNVLSPSFYTHIISVDRFMYFQDRSVYFAAAKLCGHILGKYKSLTHECMNWDWGRAIPFLRIHKFDFWYSLGGGEAAEQEQVRGWEATHSQASGCWKSETGRHTKRRDNTETYHAEEDITETSG
jgi:hypothetical protein